MTEYMELYNPIRHQTCPRFLGIKMVGRSTLERRIRKLMNLAIEMKNSVLSQVACDLTADYVGDGALLSEMDEKYKSIVAETPEQEQIAQAFLKLRLTRENV
jgi:hypothetical protein